MVAREGFSTRQWQKPRRNCRACTTWVKEAGDRGVVAKATHAYSCGLVDGKKHRAPGRRVADPTRRASAADCA
eukprot:5642135-Prymnesium_polylepis.1